MVDQVMKLEASSPLGGYQKTIGTVSITEKTEMALVSVAEPLNDAGALRAKLKTSCGADWPDVTRSTRSSDEAVQFLGVQSDMIFALFDHPGGLADSFLKEKLGDAGYLTDQSDAWVMIEIKGEGCTDALERLCPLDHSLGAFPVGNVTRTMMEHLGTLILRQADDAFVIMGAVSSADDLLHAVELSVKNTQ